TTVSGSCGSIQRAPMCQLLSSPTCVQCTPPSVDLYTPLPAFTEPPTSLTSPVPTYTTFAFDDATAMAPMLATGMPPSEMGVQIMPPSVVRHTPPPGVPM